MCCLASCLKDAQLDAPGTKLLIFVETKEQSASVLECVRDSGRHGAILHGGKTQCQREDVLDQYRSGQLQVLVATDVAARGLDVPGVTDVINYTLPSNHTVYIHRVGRAGRGARLHWQTPG